MDHDQIRHMLSELIDGSLADRDRAAIELHIRTCPECERALRELQKTIEEIKSINDADPPSWLTQQVMAKVRDAAGNKKSIVRMLLFPLQAKLVLRAVAVIFIIVASFYMYQNYRPSVQTDETPRSERKELAAARESTPPAVDKTGHTMARKAQREPAKEPQALSRQTSDMKPSLTAPSPEALPAKRSASQSFDAMKKREIPAGVDTAVKGETMAKYGTSAVQGMQSSEKLSGHFDSTIVATYPTGRPRLIVTYAIDGSNRVLRAEERFSSDGKRHGLQKEYYDSGQLKTEAYYEEGRLAWYREYTPDGVKKIEPTNSDWFWLTK